MCLWVTLPNFDLKRIVKRLRLFIFAVRYNETMTASKHLIGRDDLIISLATSYNLAIDRFIFIWKNWVPVWLYCKWFNNFCIAKILLAMLILSRFAGSLGNGYGDKSFDSLVDRSRTFKICSSLSGKLSTASQWTVSNQCHSKGNSTLTLWENYLVPFGKVWRMKHGANISSTFHFNYALCPKQLLNKKSLTSTFLTYTLSSQNCINYLTKDFLIKIENF